MFGHFWAQPLPTFDSCPDTVPMPPRLRLDLALVERGLVESRAKAQALIMAGRITVNRSIATKSGASVSPEDELAVTALEHPWVGRGGIKLAHAIDQFQIDVRDLVCADLGASTGGFTDVLLSKGAAKVYAVDVGYGQLDASLRNDSRVVLKERINARYLTSADFEEAIEFVTVDVSFIPLRLILPAVAEILTPGGSLVALIKPQFEVGREGVGKGGIVRDKAQRERAVADVRLIAEGLGFEVFGVIESPIQGAEGNVEFLMYAKKLR